MNMHTDCLSTEPVASGAFPLSGGSRTRILRASYQLQASVQSPRGCVRQDKGNHGIDVPVRQFASRDKLFVFALLPECL